MELSIIAGLSLLLGLIVYQDFSSRSIAVWTLLGILFLSFCYGIQQFSFADLAFNITFNLSFVAIQLIAISLYFSLKHQKWVNITKAHIGWGDVLFFIPMSVLFAPVNFMLFYVLSLVFALVGFLIYTLSISQTKSVSIPLAGIMAACLMILLLAKSYLGFDLEYQFVNYLS